MAVTFDFGQTLTEFDCEFLCQQLASQGVASQPARFEEALPEAWRRYDLKCASSDGAHPWRLLMRTILSLGLPENSVASDKMEALVEWLWTEQAERNLWRKPIPGMIEIVRKLAAVGTRVGVISNSEGRLALLAEQLGWQDDFRVIADSGVLGFEKPGAKIFGWTAAALDVAVSDLVHIGDSWSADVQGIRKLGGRAIWFAGASIAPVLPAGAVEEPAVRFCRSSDELEAALRSWQVAL